MTSLCIMKRGYNEIFSFPLACPITVHGNEQIDSRIPRNENRRPGMNAIDLMNNTLRYTITT